jgi:hypothetical protein
MWQMSKAHVPSARPCPHIARVRFEQVTIRQEVQVQMWHLERRYRCTGSAPDSVTRNDLVVLVIITKSL